MKKEQNTNKRKTKKYKMCLRQRISYAIGYDTIGNIWYSILESLSWWIGSCIILYPVVFLLFNVEKTHNNIALMFILTGAFTIVFFIHQLIEEFFDYSIIGWILGIGGLIGITYLLSMNVETELELLRVCEKAAIILAAFYVVSFIISSILYFSKPQIT